MLSWTLETTLAVELTTTLTLYREDDGGGTDTLYLYQDGVRCTANGAGTNGTNSTNRWTACTSATGGTTAQLISSLEDGSSACQVIVSTTVPANSTAMDAEAVVVAAAMPYTIVTT